MIPHYPELLEVLEELADFWNDNYLEEKALQLEMLQALWVVIDGVQRQEGFVTQILDNLWDAHVDEENDE